MIGRTVLGLTAALTFAGLVGGSTVYAKPCPKICRAEIKACKQGCTTKPKGKCRKSCTRSIVKICKDSGKTACVLPGSPSAAFLL